MALETNEIIKHETCIDMRNTINGSRYQWKIPMKFVNTNKHALDTNFQWNFQQIKHALDTN